MSSSLWEDEGGVIHFMTDIVNKLWGFCHTLRHDGIDYGDYIEQLTYLLFLKMADEKGIIIPERLHLGGHQEGIGTGPARSLCRHTPEVAEEKGLLGDIFTQSVPRFNNPVNLKRLITMIDEEEWSALDIDVKARPSRASWKRPPARERRVQASTLRPEFDSDPSSGS